QGAAWEPGVTFARPAPINLKPRPVVLPDGPESHPVDRLLGAYFGTKGVTPAPVVDDATFARRAYFDVIGLPPTANQLDEFVSDWSLADAYGFAAVFADKPLEMVHCDKPTGQIATPRFIYPQIGAIDDRAPRPERLKRLAELMTSPKNGRVPRTIVNRLWAKL